MRRVLTDKMSVEMTGHSEACINRQICVEMTGHSEACINRQYECRDDRT